MSRFKTELCNNLIELGSCKYGDRCHYAHGAHELRQVSRRHPKYRTEKCKNFELTGKCPFGPRCSYVHPKPDLDSMIEQLTKYMQHIKAPKPDLEEEDEDENKENRLADYQLLNKSKNQFIFHSPALNDPFSSSKNNLTSSSRAKPFLINNSNSQAPSTLIRTPLGICVIAGATSHTISNTSKTPINHQLNNHYRASFIDFILDASLIKLLQSSNTIQYSSNHKSTTTKFHQQSQTVCALLSNLLSGLQLRFCQRHQDVLETILPQVIQLTKKECTRITNDLRWNCAAIDLLLDRSNPLAFTKEASLVRSILNASMMYLVVKTCSDTSHRSCGCQNSQQYSGLINSAHENTHQSHILYTQEERIMKDEHSVSSLDQQDLSPSDLSKLDAGSPLRLTKSISQHQGCLANTAFANAFTKVFIDSDDIRTLNKAYRILNEEPNYNELGNRSATAKRLIDSDQKDLSYIKWTKSAINLHNNQVGRQMVRQATQRRCRCHGMSGVCQFQTCWDHLLDFNIITSRLRSLYLSKTIEVEVKNMGSFEKPDLYLTRLKTSSSASIGHHLTSDFNDKGQLHDDTLPTIPTSFIAASDPAYLDRIRPEELLYLYNSPEYCEPQPKIRHPGTRGRICALSNNNVTITTKTSKKSIRNAELTQRLDYITTRQEGLDGAPGSCEHLCCSRGYYSELVLDMVTCNCRFKFCCKIDCEHCLRQRVQHFCL